MVLAECWASPQGWSNRRSPKASEGWALVKVAEMALRKRVTGSGFQVLLEPDCHLLRSELDTDID